MPSDLVATLVGALRKNKADGNSSQPEVGAVK